MDEIAYSRLKLVVSDQFKQIIGLADRLQAIEAMHAAAVAAMDEENQKKIDGANLLFSLRYCSLLPRSSVCVFIFCASQESM